MHILSICVYVYGMHAQCPGELEEVIRSIEIGVMDDYNVLCGFWEPNTGFQ